MNYDILVVCAPYALKTARSRIEDTQKEGKKKAVFSR